MNARSDRPPVFRWRPFISFDDTNLVGNVYFARLVAWQGTCREAFLAEYAPDVIESLARDLRLVTLRVSCDFFEELRAFDALDIEMRLTARAGHRLSLEFDYRVQRDGHVLLAAQGAQEIACMRDIGGGELRPAELPASLSHALSPFTIDSKT